MDRRGHFGSGFAVAEPTPLLFAFDLIEHDGDDLRDLPVIDRKRRLAKLIGKAKRPVTRDGQTAFPKNWSLRNMPGALSWAQNSVIVGCAPRC